MLLASASPPFWSLVIGHWSLVIGQRILDFGLSVFLFPSNAINCVIKYLPILPIPSIPPISPCLPIPTASPSPPSLLQNSHQTQQQRLRPLHYGAVGIPSMTTEFLVKPGGDEYCDRNTPQGAADRQSPMVGIAGPL